MLTHRADHDANATPGASGDNDGKKPLVTGRANSDNESVLSQRHQSRGREHSLAPSSASPPAPHAERGQSVPGSRLELDCAGITCRQGLGCPRHPKLSEMWAKADNALCPPYTLSDGSSDTAETEHGHSAPQEATCSAETGGDEDCLPRASSGSQEGTLRSEKSDTSDLATTEPTSQPPDSQDRVDGRRDISRDHNTRFEDCHPHTHPSDDGGEQDKEGSVVPPQAQESRAHIPSLSGDQSDNERELANTEPSIQPSARQDQVRLHNVGRRRRCDTDDEENCPPSIGSDAKQGKDEDVIRPPQGKRRRVNTSAATTRRTAPKRQARLHCTNSQSLQAQRPPNQGPKRRQS